MKHFLISLFAVTMMAVGCAKNSNSNSQNGPSDPVAPDQEKYNTNSDAAVEEFMMLPKAGDVRLLDVSELPDSKFVLNDIQSVTVAWNNGTIVQFAHKIGEPGAPSSQDEIKAEVKKQPKDKKNYRLAIQFNLPLDFSVASKVLSWGSIKEYWNQVYTDGRKEWVLNSKKDATAINPSIDEALKHQTGKGIYSYSPKSTILNTVFLTKEGDDLHIYLKTQMKSETGYVKLKYSKKTQQQSSTGILEAKGKYDVLAGTLKELQIDLELEVESSDGSRNNSLFGTKREGEDLADLVVLNEEVSRIEKLVQTIKENLEILNKIKEKGIAGIRILNPYVSKNKPGIITDKSSRKILLLSLDQDSISILALLSN